MIKNISPEKFKKIFMEVNIEMEEELLSVYSDTKEYTRLFLGGQETKEGFLRNVSDKLGLNFYREYWTIDAIFFEDKNTEFFPKESTYANYISVAIEHESIGIYAYNEINKLTTLNTPLKVLITYTSNSDKDRSLLNDYHKIIKQADIFSDFETKRKHLVIFGDNKQLNWRFYLYADKDFIELK